MRILYIGAHYGTTYHREQALKRLGHDVVFVDPFTFIPSNRWAAKWIHETGAFGFDKYIQRQVLHSISGKNFDLTFVDGGYVIGRGLVKALKKRTGCIINYNADDPFPIYGWRKWRLFRESIPEYDLLAVVREQNVNEVRSAGAKRVLRIFMSADEIVHRPIYLTKTDLDQYASEVVFVGTWMPERGPFMARLLDRGVPLSIWGERWYKAKEWEKIKNVWRGPGLNDDAYPRAIQASKICLGLLSVGNRDLHTQRSLEIPAMGCLFCAERTSEHQQLYKEGHEAVFWDDADECSERCLELLKNPQKCKEIATQGRERCLRNNHFNEPILKLMIETVS